MKAIVRALGVSRSNLLEQRSKRQKAPEAATESEPAVVAEAQETGENGVLLARIRELVGERPSYGYRRVTALLNRELSERVNPKRIYGIMRRNKLLLERCTGDGRGRKHDGVIITLKPDLRWRSDSFEIRCWDGARVFVTFVLDCCDREVTGSIYTSDETRTFGAEIGFVMCNTPPYSPESNGMAESFVKSFKRDYVYLAEPVDRRRRAPRSAAMV